MPTVAWLGRLEVALGEEAYSRFIDLMEPCQSGTKNYEKLYTDVNEIFATIADETDYNELFQGFLDLLPRDIQLEYQARRAHEATARSAPREPPNVVDPDLQPLISYAWYVKHNVTYSVYQRFSDIFILYAEKWPRYKLPMEAYEEIKRILVDTPDLLEGLKQFMSDQDLRQIRHANEAEAFLGSIDDTSTSLDDLQLS